ncbi:MAG TPA: hypothetical protein VIH12_00095 [Solibacillus sp.]
MVELNYAMYVFCMLIWGLNFIAVKIQGTEAALEVSLFYRSLIAFVLFVLYAAEDKEATASKGAYELRHDYWLWDL